VALRWEQLNAKYESNSRSGELDSKNADGKIKVNALTYGANYWVTSKLRLSLNHSFYMFPDSTGPAGTADQRALAPGNTLKGDGNKSTRESAHSMHEFTARIGIAF